MWTQQQAIELCRLIEETCPTFDCHVALTGGLLYKDGPRKDCDLLFYRVRQKTGIQQARLFRFLQSLGFSEIKGRGWCFKSSYECKGVDIFFPEEQDGDTPVVPNSKGVYLR